MIWLDGAVHEESRAAFDLADRGLLLGDGLFETIGVFGHIPFRLASHLDRLAQGADVLGFAVDRTSCETAVNALAAHAAAGRGIVRLTVTRGAGGRGLAPPSRAAPHIHASLAPWQPGMAYQPVRLATLSIRRNETSPASRLKTLAYLDNVLGLGEANRKGAGDGLFLNSAGHVVSTTMANIFVAANGVVRTPPAGDGVLPGTMRRLLLDTLASQMPLQEATLTMADVLRADEVFLTNSVRLVIPVFGVDQTPFREGAVTRAAFDAIAHAIQAECGDAIR